MQHIDIHLGSDSFKLFFNRKALNEIIRKSEDDNKSIEAWVSSIYTLPHWVNVSVQNVVNEVNTNAEGQSTPNDTVNDGVRIGLK